MFSNYFSLVILCICLFFQCQSPQKRDTTESQESVESNPAASGFDQANSDDEAIALADDVMEAMGGRAKWDNTNCFSWNFFDRRKLYWDKATGNVRIEFLTEDTQAIVNLKTMKGKVQQNGELLTQPDSVNKYLNRAKSVWINDMYWLFMPFKLKDSGVTLTYGGPSATEDGRAAKMVELTFKDVGDTPQNRYQVWVDDESKLVTQWSWYRESAQQEPNFITPWTDYQDYNGLKLSGNRGQRQLTEIAVYASFPDELFVDFSPIVL